MEDYNKCPECEARNSLAGGDFVEKKGIFYYLFACWRCGTLVTERMKPAHERV